MYNEIQNFTISLIFLVLYQISFTGEDDLAGRNESLELTNLEEITFGSATLHFDTKGTKVLVNVNDFPKDKLAFYLKRGENLTEIPNDTLIEDSSFSTGVYDSTGANYHIKKVSYTLNSTDDEVVVKLKEKPTSFKGLFALSQSSKITLNNFQTENVKTMEFMFLQCGSLIQLDIFDWDTSNVTNMNSMFYLCTKLTQINVSNWNTSNVINMNSMFYRCSELTQINVSNWNTSNVINMNSMFYRCSELTQLDLSNWDTSNVNNMNNMFYECISLKELNLISINTPKIINSSYIQSFLYTVSSFQKCAYYKYRSDLPGYFHRDCSDLLGFYYCGNCTDEGDSYCNKTFEVGKSGSDGT